MTTTTAPATNTQGQNLLMHIKSTADSMEKGDVLGSALGVTTVAMDVIGLTGNPLGGISSAGVGWVLGAVSFLKEPFDVLKGDPGAITGSAQSWGTASSNLTSTANRYRGVSTSQTKTWTGTAGNSYRAASGNQADGLDSLAQASKTVSGAIQTAGQAVAQARKSVLDLISEAVQKIVQICIEALSKSWLSFGASIAMGIAQSVQKAVQTGAKLVQEIQKVVQTLQKIVQVVQQVMQIVGQVKQLLETIGGKATGQQTSTPTAQQVNYNANPNGLNPTDTGIRPSNAQEIAPGYQFQEVRNVAENGTQIAQADPPPDGVPSWGEPSGPPPDQGRAATNTQVRDWIDQARQALISHGVDANKMNADQMAALIQHESSNNPHAINLWDSNAERGTPSKGLMQTIDPTFEQYKLRGYDNIYSPVDNIIAGTRYAIDRYGSISNVPGVVALTRGRAYRGY